MNNHSIFPSEDYRNYNGGNRAFVRCTEDFIDKAKFVWGDSCFDYSDVVFVQRNKAVTIKCPIHGEFKVCPRNHIESKMGGGCKECVNEELRRQRQNSIYQWIEKFKNVHGDSYDYSEFTVAPDNAHVKIPITCNTCGDRFESTIGNHVRGKGCRRCGYVKSGQSLRLDRDIWIERFQEIHGRGRYTYHINTIEATSDPMIVTCNVHGDFKVSPDNHLRRQSGCPKCANLLRYEKEIESLSAQEAAMPCYLYFLKFTSPSESFHKVGITRFENIYDRFQPYHYGQYSIDIIYHLKLNVKEARTLELDILMKMEEETARYKLRHLKDIFGGWTECFYLHDFDPSNIIEEFIPSEFDSGSRKEIAQ